MDVGEPELILQVGQMCPGGTPSHNREMVDPVSTEMARLVINTPVQIEPFDVTELANQGALFLEGGRQLEWWAPH